MTSQGKGQVNMSIVDEQLKQDRERLAGHKLKWKRPWTISSDVAIQDPSERELEREKFC